MKLTFIELSPFSTVRDTYFGDDENFRAFQNELIASPSRGDVIPGTGGTRKVRVADPRRGKGKRGGLRVVYLHIPEIETIALFAVYDKDEASDLTSQQKKNIATAVAAVRKELIEGANSGSR